MNEQDRLNAIAREEYERALVRLERVKTTEEIFEAGWNACYRRCHPPVGPSGPIHNTPEEAFRALVEEYER
jgi:hypothetical protein